MKKNLVTVSRIGWEEICFSNGDRIYSTYTPACYEYNWADFEQLKNTPFEEFAFSEDEELFFNTVDGGFRFGTKNNQFFVPCYSEQNGFYSYEVEIWYVKNGIEKNVLNPWGQKC